MDPVQIGILGCGNIVQRALSSALLQISGAQVVALADPDAARLTQVGQRFPQARLCSRPEELLNDPHVQAVLIATPNADHAANALNALAQGKHIYLEKPLAANLEEGRLLTARWRTSGLIGMIGFNYRFNALYQRAHQIIADEKIGQPLAVQSMFCSSSQRQLPEWKKNRQTGGGILLDLGSHHIDLITHWLNARVETVQAQIQSQRTDSDTAALTLQLNNGIIAQCFFSSNAADHDRIEVVGTHGRLMIDRYHSLQITAHPGKVEYSWVRRLIGQIVNLRQTPDLWGRLCSPARETSYHAALQHFIRAIQQSQSAQPDFEDGLRALEVIAAAELSVLQHQPTTVSYSQA